jgi:hypothetical protein
MAFNMDPMIVRQYQIVPGAAAVQLDNFQLDGGLFLFCGSAIIMGADPAAVNAAVATLGANSGIGIAGQVGPFSRVSGLWVASTSKLAADLVIVLGPAAEAR